MAVLEFSPTIGDRIVLALRKANMTQSQLAERLHVAPSSVSRWVSEKTPIDVPTLQKIAIITGQRRLILDLADLPDPEPTEPGNVVPISSGDGTPDQPKSPLGWMWETAGQAA